MSKNGNSKSWGLPYFGSKSQIVEKAYGLIKVDLAGESYNGFVDVFGGGGAISHYFASKGESIIYNDADADLHRVFETIKRTNDTKTLFCDNLLDYGRIFEMKKGGGVLSDIDNAKYYLNKTNSTFHRNFLQILCNPLSTSANNFADRISKFKDFLLSNKVKFTNRDYRWIATSHNTVLVCDPPYIGTDIYEQSFDYQSFIEWIKNMPNQHKYIFGYAKEGEYFQKIANLGASKINSSNTEILYKFTN